MPSCAQIAIKMGGCLGITMSY